MAASRVSENALCGSNSVNVKRKGRGQGLQNSFFFSILAAIAADSVKRQSSNFNQKR